MSLPSRECFKKFMSFLFSNEHSIFEYISGNKAEKENNKQKLSELTTFDNRFELEFPGLENLKKDLILNRNDPSIRLFNILSLKNKQLEKYRRIFNSQEDKINDLRETIESFKKKIINLVGYVSQQGSDQEIVEEMVLSLSSKTVVNLHRFVDKIIDYQKNEGKQRLSSLLKDADDALKEDLGLTVNYEDLEIMQQKKKQEDNRNIQFEFIESKAVYCKAIRNFLVHKSHSFDMDNRGKRNKKPQGRLRSKHSI